MKLITKITGVGAALLLASSSASAIVTNWDYSVTSIFTAATYTGGGGSAPGTGTLSWGTSTGSGQSSLVVSGSPAIGNVDTYLGVAPPTSPPFLGLATSLTHNNNPITGTTLTSAVLTNTVFLDPVVPNNPLLPAQVVPFNIAFTETANSGTCAVVTSPTPCNDIFVLTSGLLNFFFDYDDNLDTVTDRYFVNIFPVTGGVLSVLPAAECIAVGQLAGCIGFSTPENLSTTLQFGFTISTLPLQVVPEPGILALLGIGLMGMFAWRRRQS